MKNKCGACMNNTSRKGFGMIEMLIVLMIIVIGFFVVRNMQQKGAPTSTVEGQLKAYDSAKEQINKIKSAQ
jgi:prepilin-type N-terminal cleavage/methylation domain-containing protein